MKSISTKNRNNWLLDSLLALSGIIVGLSSIYFLYLPVGGYKGGRNPFYGVTILFERRTWDDLHTWVGLVMTVIALVHFIIHIDWAVAMAKRVYREIFKRTAVLNARGRFNILVDALIALGFFGSAVSGIIFFLFIGEKSLLPITGVLLWSKVTWDLIHTWSGIVMMGSAVVHFAIHWRWVVKIMGRVFLRSANPAGTVAPVSVES